MQYVRLYINDAGEIEHTETNSRPLRATPSIEIHEPITPPVNPNDPPGPTQKKLFDMVDFELEASLQGFRRARDIMNSYEVDKTTLQPRAKVGNSGLGMVKNIKVTRVSQGHGNNGNG